MKIQRSAQTKPSTQTDEPKCIVNSAMADLHLLPAPGAAPAAGCEESRFRSSAGHCAPCVCAGAPCTSVKDSPASSRVVAGSQSSLQGQCLPLLVKEGKATFIL